MSSTDKVLSRTEHRPYPLPDGVWALAMSWHDLLLVPLMTARIIMKLPDTEPLLHYTHRLDVVAWPPRRIYS